MHARLMGAACALLLAGAAIAAPASPLVDKLRDLEHLGQLSDPAGVVAEYPPLYARVEEDRTGYRFTRFSLHAEKGPGWVQLYSGQRMWEVRRQDCLRHPLNGDCEKVERNAFVRVDSHPVQNVIAAAITVGIRPLFFGIDTTYRFDAAKWESALAAAKARYTHETGLSLQEDLDRLRADWEILMALEQKGREALRRRELAVAISGATPALLAAGREGMVGVAFRHPWRDHLALQSERLGELVAQIDTAVQQHGQSRPRDWPLQLTCPSPRLALYALAESCDLQGDWRDDKLRITGALRLKGVALPRQFPTVLAVAGSGIEAEYRHGVVWLRNKSDKTLLLEKITLLMGGKEVPRWVSRKELKPGEDAFYAGFTLDLPEVRPPAASALLDPIRLGTSTRYGLRLQLLEAGTYAPVVVEEQAEATLEELLAHIFRSEAGQAEALDYEALKRIGRVSNRP